MRLLGNALALDKSIFLSIAGSTSKIAASHHVMACGYSVCSVPVVPLGVQFVSLCDGALARGPFFDLGKQMEKVSALFGKSGAFP